jgi:Holliday junction resolvasome RuvABC DNA-binding subunit
MEGDSDLLETLVSLGYRREEARNALAHIDPKLSELQDRLKAALKVLSGKV